MPQHKGRPTPRLPRRTGGGKVTHRLGDRNPRTFCPPKLRKYFARKQGFQERNQGFSAVKARHWGGLPHVGMGQPAIGTEHHAAVAPPAEWQQTPNGDCLRTAGSAAPEQGKERHGTPRLGPQRRPPSKPQPRLLTATRRFGACAQRNPRDRETRGAQQGRELARTRAVPTRRGAGTGGGTTPCGGPRHR